MWINLPLKLRILILLEKFEEKLLKFNIQIIVRALKTDKFRRNS